MRYTYIEPFVTSTLQVLGAVIHGPVHQGDLAVMEGERIKGDVAVAVKIGGDAEGDIVFSTNTATALDIFKELSGQDWTAMTSQSFDALAELVNMIAGNAVSALNDKGFDFTIAPPVVVSRSGREALAGTESLEIPLTWNRGEMTMNIFLGTD